MKKFIIFMVICLSLIFVSCGKDKPKTEELSEEIKAEYLSGNEEIIKDIYAENYEKVREELNEEMKEKMTDEVFKGAVEYADKKGEFIEFGESDAMKVFDEKAKENYIFTQTECKHEKGSVIFTISYDENGKIAGLFVK